MLVSIAGNLRHALLTIWRRPGFALLAVLILALGIGTTAAVFSMIHGVLLTEPPYTAPDRLVVVSATDADDRAGVGRRAFTESQWLDWQSSVPSFASVAGYRWAFNFLVRDDGSESLEGMLVSHDYFDVVGLDPLLGRAFGEADDRGTETSAIILGYELWQRRFSGDPDVIGQTVRLTANPAATVVGVMPPNVRFLPSPGVAQEPNYDLHARVDYWMPIRDDLRERPIWNVVARLGPSMTNERAEAELDVVFSRQAQADTALTGLGVRIDGLLDLLNGEGRQILLPLLAAAGLVLLIACGNAAALLLIRGLQREHEYGLRGAVGAGRGHLFGHVIVESLALAALGGALGIILALGIVATFKRIGGEAIPRLEDVSTGWPVLAFGLGAAVLACMLAGLVPAWRASRLDPMTALRGSQARSSEGRGQRRLLSLVVIGQTALTLALLVGAGLLIRTMYKLDAVGAGYDTSGVLTMSVAHAGAAGREDWLDFHTRALERVAELPGVEGAAFAWGVPLTGNSWPTEGIRIEGGPAADTANDRIAAPLRAVSSGYFELLGQALTAGRDIRATDGTEAAHIAIVNEAFVARHLGNAPALGRRLWLRGPDDDPAVIVGVVSNGRTNDLSLGPEPEIYMSLWQYQAFSKHLVVRTRRSAETMAADVQRELKAIAPTAAVENMKTLEDIRGGSLATRTFAARLLIGFAVIASVLTLGGVYSVLSLSVAARRRELAIRSAVGARRETLRRLILGQAVRMIVAGMTAGILMAIVLSRLLESLLFEVAGADPLTLLVALAAFGGTALLACWLPARHAARTNPVEALRAD